MMKRIVFLLLCIGAAGWCNAVDEVLRAGTLIVTYQTDAQGERIDRIRFWLKDEAGKQRLYPLENGYVDDPRTHARMVVVEGLLPGKYKLEFLVPNTDGYFVEVPVRRIVVAKGDVAKIDQKIKPRKTYWKKTAKSKLSPSKQSPAVVESVPEVAALPVAPSLGKLIVSFEAKGECPQTQDVQFKLIDSLGAASVHPKPDVDTEIPLRTGSMVVVNNVPAGSYTLEFYIDEVAGKTSLAMQSVDIEADKTKSVHQTLSFPEAVPAAEEAPAPSISTSSLSVTANIPAAFFLLQDEAGKEQWVGRGRQHFFESLAPGRYLLSCESEDPFFAPPLQRSIEVVENGENEAAVIFKSLGRIRLSGNVEGAKVLIRDIDNADNTHEMEIKDGVGEVYLPEGEYRIIFSGSVEGKAPPQPMAVSVSALHSKELDVYFAPLQ